VRLRVRTPAGVSRNQKCLLRLCRLGETRGDNGGSFRLQRRFEMLLVFNKNQIAGPGTRYARNAADFRTLVADNLCPYSLCDLPNCSLHGTCFIRLRAERKVSATTRASSRSRGNARGTLPCLSPARTYVGLIDGSIGTWKGAASAVPILRRRSPSFVCYEPPRRMSVSSRMRSCNAKSSGSCSRCSVCSPISSCPSGGHWRPRFRSES